MATRLGKLDLCVSARSIAKLVRTLGIALCGSWILVACGGGANSPTPPTLQSISVSPQNGTVAAGITQQFSATGHYSDGSSNTMSSVTCGLYHRGSGGKTSCKPTAADRRDCGRSRTPSCSVQGLGASVTVGTCCRELLCTTSRDCRVLRRNRDRQEVRGADRYRCVARDPFGSRRNGHRTLLDCG
jgi:hypothetical protein